jgi:hypothetical protein
MMPRNLRLTLVSCGMPFGSTLLARRLAGADQGRDRPQPPGLVAGPGPIRSGAVSAWDGRSASSLAHGGPAGTRRFSVCPHSTQQTFVTYETWAYCHNSH